MSSQETTAPPAGLLRQLQGMASADAERILDPKSWPYQTHALVADASMVAAQYIALTKAAVTLVMALEKIAADAPAKNPGMGEWDDMETAFGCGIDAACFEKAQLAREALATVRAMDLGIVP